MRQRNDTGYTQSISAWPTDEHPNLAPFEVPPGGECDHPELLVGFTAIDSPVPSPDAKPSKKAASSKTDSSEGGEPA